MDYKFVTCEKDGSIATVTLNRPEKLNALNDAMIDDIDNLLLDLEHDVDIKVVIIKGAGQAFSVGRDLGIGGATELTPDQLAPKEAMERERRRQRRWEYIFNYPKVTIAQIHGHCLGTALDLAMVCDLAIASEDAVFGDPSIRMGITSSMALWTWYVGLKKARELLYFGKTISGREAEELGLINVAVPSDKLQKEVQRYAQAISLCPGDGLVLAKEAISGVMEIRGVGPAWRYMGDMHSALAQRGLALAEEEFDFFKTRDEKGWKEAVIQRDAPFKNLDAGK